MFPACTILRPAAFSESDVKFQKEKKLAWRLVFCGFLTSRELFSGILKAVFSNDLFFH